MRWLWPTGSLGSWWGSGVKEEKHDPITSYIQKQKAQGARPTKGRAGNFQPLIAWAEPTYPCDVLMHSEPPLRARKMVRQQQDNTGTAKGHAEQIALLTLSRKDIILMPFGRLNSSGVLFRVIHRIWATG